MSQEERRDLPLIGITAGLGDDGSSRGDVKRYALAMTYVRAVERAGGLPIILPPQVGQVSELIALLDGVLLSGGGDIRPSRYGDAVEHPETYGIDDFRDEFELAVVRAALERELPLLGICRGIQVLNVALGGTLIQDIADEWGTTLEHRQSRREVPFSEPSHEVEVRGGSLLEAIYGASVVAVNSFHHQAVKIVAPGLQVVGWAPDGVIEGVEFPERRFVLGVQWHPEMMFEAHSEHLQPFRGLVEAAREARAGGGGLGASR